MAPAAAKLKQSSLDSFLLVKPPPVTTAAEVVTSSDYERLRQENIRRNKDFLHNLGIIPRSSSKPPQHRKRNPLKTLLHTQNPSLPLRRSTRKRAESSSPSSEAHHKEEDNVQENSPPQYPQYVDSSVLQYTCESSEDHPLPLLPSSPLSSILGFRTTGKTFRSPSLTKMYTVDVCHVKETRHLVAAGGHGGYISIFGGEDDGHSERETEGPLMSWKGSLSWVSGVIFVDENPMLLVSCSNDGSLIVWDIAKHSSSLSPPVVTEFTGLHSSGIFSMDRLNCSFATASKDSSVAISRLMTSGRLVVDRYISGHHSGVIRGVCFGDTKDRLADCGADGCIGVLDTRLPQPCTMSIKSKHSTGVNTVEWCPSNMFLLLSASKDPALLLYDIRNSTEPVNELQGHVESNSRTCYQIYKPAFVDNGTAIATPGQGSRKISLYSVGEGKLISQGLIDCDANLVLYTAHNTEQQRLWTAGKQINQLCPLVPG